METISRRSALSLAAAATTLAAGGSEALAQGNALSPEGKLPPGVSRKALGKGESWIPAYKSVSVLDLIYQPGAKSANGNMPDDMVCQCMEGQLHISSLPTPYPFP